MARNWSPYRFGFNNPILFSDPSGLWEVKGNGSWYTEDEKDIERFLDMISIESDFRGGATTGQIAQFVGEEFRGSGGRLSDGSLLLDSEVLIGNSKGKSKGLKDRQIDNIQSQHEKFSSDFRNDATMDYYNQSGQFYSYEYFRERSWQENGGSFPGIDVASYALGVSGNVIFNSKSWFSFTQMKSYSHNFHGNQFTESRVNIGNLSKALNAGGKLLGAYGLYSTYGEWQNGKLTNFGASYLGASGGLGLAKSPVGAAWAVGTGMGKSIVESSWYFQAVYGKKDF